MSMDADMRVPAAGAGAVGPPPVDDGGGARMRWLQRMRDEHPVWRDGVGMYHVFRYDDVAAILGDAVRFSSDINRLNPQNQSFDGGSLMLSDPPHHQRLRALINQGFTPRIVAGLAPRIAELTGELLNEIEGDEFDLVGQLAHPLPVSIIAELLGIPVVDRALFRGWTDQMVAMRVDDPGNADLGKAVGEAMQEMGAFLLAHVQARRTRPQQDLISQLLAAELEGRRLRDDEIVNISCVLLLAGQFTSTMALGNAALCLAGAPGALEQLRADPSLIPHALEEVLRQRPPLTQLARVTTQDVVIGTDEVPADRIVVSWVLSANNDERQFPEPERFDVRRKPAKHVGFGHGIHYCVGAPLARLEGKIALELLLDRFSDISFPDPAALPYYEDPMFGPKELPLVVQRSAPWA